MKFCPECGHDFNEQGTCDCCGYPKVRKEEPTNQAIGVFDDSGPKFGMLDSPDIERLIELNKNKKYDPATGEEIKEVTRDDMLKPLEKLGFVSKEELNKPNSN